jgi:methionyl-tRNA formyltransferase
MRSVVFMGSPDFAIPALQALIDSPDYDVKLVVSQTDKPQGRKQILTAPPVKQLALQYSIPVYQPKTLRTPEALETIGSIGPDFIVVAAYGKILPQAVLDVPKFGCVNLHGSLLPKYRGAAPIQWSVLNGDAETGVTSMLMNAGLDTGDILLTAKTPIGENETAGELFERLAAMSPALLLETLEKLANGELTPVPQNEAEATVVGMLDKEMATLDFNVPAREVHNKIRGLNPWPVAKTTFENKTLKLFAGLLTDRRVPGVPGTLLADRGRLFVSCAENEGYEITELQLEGAKRMPAADFLRGHPVNAGCVLGLKEVE